MPPKINSSIKRATSTGLQYAGKFELIEVNVHVGTGKTATSQLHGKLDIKVRRQTHHPDVKRRLVFVSPEVVVYEATICKATELNQNFFLSR